MEIIKIGREEKGKNCITVPQDRSMVGRHHAQLNVDMENGTMTISENDAKNGTYLNGTRISKSRNLKMGDEVWLGEKGPLGYQVNVDDILKKIKSDYSVEFKEVISKYEEYFSQVQKIKKKYNNKYILPRKIVGAVCAVAGVIAFFLLKDPTNRIAVISIGGAVGALLALIPANSESVNKSIMELKLKYEDYYVCPKCGTKFNLDRHWKFMLKNGCTNPKCNAKFNNINN